MFMLLLMSVDLHARGLCSTFRKLLCGQTRSWIDIVYRLVSLHILVRTGWQSCFLHLMSTDKLMLTNKVPHIG